MVRVLQGFRATVELGEPPLVPVRPATAASLVGMAGAESLMWTALRLSASDQGKGERTVLRVTDTATINRTLAGDGITNTPYDVSTTVRFDPATRLASRAK
ncbi:hypothetical protein [Streptomyces cyaneofuscatus]|uniref:hypothetical protein n=1 Tax=Streptomyces cyaneofuscatus TaxID=66883 RepID=UPI003655AF6B